MKKSALYLAIGACCVSAVFLVLGVGIDGPLGGVCSGLAGGFAGVGIGNIVRWRLLKRKPDSDFTRHVHQVAIDQKDERNLMLRDRSGYVAMQAVTTLLCVLVFVFTVLHALGVWSPMGKYLAFASFGFMLLIWLCYYLAFRYFEKRC